VERIEKALEKVTGKAWSLRFDLASGATEAPKDGGVTRARKARDEAGQSPLVKRALEHLDAQIVSVEDGFGARRDEAGNPDSEES
jgi:hypothetical protein